MMTNGHARFHIVPPTSASVRLWESEPEVILMLRVKADEPGAFTELVDHWWPKIFGRFYKQLGDRQEAEDLAQDVFLRLYRNRRRYEPKARFSTWLYHIARNVARNAIRSRTRRSCLILSRLKPFPFDDAREAQFASRCDDSPARPLEREEITHVVRIAMRELALRQRVALELQFQDCSYTEIAAELHVSAKAAKSLLYRARMQLRQHLEGYVLAGAT
ncbi:MAG TPA: sigma-70 family RNA polymerase sigma factor [Gemmataceae bacterium]|jgi:RNA polymerase sigma-70 factor (ECF subfamily)|nr:sigma-70 family RNA polymerase sigma factor [Gemmataceae bacterium]